jgi:hypothetical protein
MRKMDQKEGGRNEEEDDPREDRRIWYDQHSIPFIFLLFPLLPFFTSLWSITPQLEVRHAGIPASNIIITDLVPGRQMYL